MQIWIENRKSGQMVEVTGGCVRCEILHKRNNGASVLTAELLCEELFFENGCVIRAAQEDTVAFRGFLFNIQQGSGRVWLRAYDQLRYLKMKDTMLVRGKSLSSLLREICGGFGLKAGIVENTPGLLENQVLTARTLLDILYGKMAETEALTGKKYVLYDSDGRLCLQQEDKLMLPLMMGDATICLDWRVERDIDEDTYNKIVLANESVVFGIRKVYEAADGQAMKKHGVLQYYKRVNQDLTSGQLQAMGQNLLKEKKQEKRRVRITALGDLSVRGGSLLTVQLGDLPSGVYRVLQVRHLLECGKHTMEMEVEGLAG